MTNTPTFTLRTETQRALFVKELKGQMSDGYWENSRPYDHWKPWCSAKVRVGRHVGRNFRIRKDNYAFDSRQLLDCVGDRMLKIARRASGNKDYSLANLRKDLRQIKSAARTFNEKSDQDENECPVSLPQIFQATFVQMTESELEHYASIEGDGYIALFGEYFAILDHSPDSASVQVHGPDSMWWNLELPPKFQELS